MYRDRRSHGVIQQAHIKRNDKVHGITPLLGGEKSELGLGGSKINRVHLAIKSKRLDG